MNKIKNFLSKKTCTLLCVGPMSRNCIDVSIDISKQFNIPMVLIASRRQIDTPEFGGGYVENFTTAQFSDYVRSKSAEQVYLARDHGGPWQSISESSQNMDLDSSMKSAKRSFEHDILAGFDFIHIDPSIPIQGENLTIDKILDRLFDLYFFCHEVARKNGREIEFELGTEEQDGFGQDLDKLRYFLEKINVFCTKHKMKKPAFVVAQTGTKVLETQNVGIFKKDINVVDELSLDHLKETLEICKGYELLLKEHNTDYLCDEALSLRPIIGIPASNVAPEFGVAETKAFLYLLSTHGYKKELDFFVRTSLESGKWKKWMLPDTSADDLDKAIICGHYIFSDPEIVKMREYLHQELVRKNIDVTAYLKTNIKTAIMRYVHLFNMI